MNTNRAPALALLLVFFAQPCLAAEGSEPGVPPKTNLKRIVNKPEIIHTDVDSYKDGDDVWITMEADVQVCTDIPFAKLKNVIMDYGKYADVFKRITASEVLNKTEAGTELFMQLTVSALGITFVTGYTQLIEEIDEPGRFLFRFSHLAGDGTVKNVHSYWYFQAVDIGGKPYTYIRYYSASEALKKHALQKLASGMFIASEYTGIMKELLAAAKKQNQ
jgi:hypothetical protein